VVLYCIFFVMYAICMSVFLNNLVIILVSFLKSKCKSGPFFLFCFVLDVVFLFFWILYLSISVVNS
jgi:hypothetical protein